MALGMIRTSAMRTLSHCQGCKRLLVSPAKPLRYSQAVKRAYSRTPARVRNDVSAEGRDLEPWGGRTYGSISPWSPSNTYFKGLGSFLNEFQKEMDSMLDRSFPEDFVKQGRGMRLSVDLSEDDKNYFITADTPGISKYNIKLQVLPNNVLEITGERTVVKDDESKDKSVQRIERSYGQFSRRFQLPRNTEPENIKASSQDGVLTITVPKVEKNDPDVREITIQ